MDVQSANLAVHGYATDQSYLRLESELPRFQRPVALVMLFMTALLGRNLDDNRPHLGPAALATARGATPLIVVPQVQSRRRPRTDLTAADS